MSDRTTDRWDRPARVWALALFDLLATCLCLVGAVRPPSEASPAELNALAAGIGVALVAVLWRLGRRVPDWLLHLNVAVLIGFTTLLCAVAATGEGAASSAFTYVGVTLYVALFFPRWVVRSYAGLICLASITAFVANDAVTIPLTAWWPVALMAILSGEVLTSSLAQIRVLTVTDPLTGALNRAGFEDGARREVAAANRSRLPLTVVVVDLDGFKSINDRQGHAAGDAVLAELAAGWRAALRPRDLLARLGGDEFAVLLPETTAREAEALVARLRDRTAAAWSYGVAEVDLGEGLHAALHRADERMYRRKAGDVPSHR